MATKDKKTKRKRPQGELDKVPSKYDLPVQLRLRRAILEGDALLVKRIAKKYPKYLHNPDFDDKSNTSLHLAAILGNLEVVKLLVSLGHDSCEPDIAFMDFDGAPGISLNTDSSTPLHLAAANSHADCADYLATVFKHSIDWQDKNGATALMLASQSSNISSQTSNTSSLVPPRQRPRASSSASNPASFEDTSTVSKLIKRGASLTMADSAGNTVLHYASAWGNLKTFRLLISAGAPPLARNHAKCAPADYALSVQAAAYCRSLVTEYERAKKGQHDQDKLSLKVRSNDIPPGDSHLSPISPASGLRPKMSLDSQRTAQSYGIGGVRLVSQDESDQENELRPSVSWSNPGTPI
ncbi:target of rapamycin complex 2 subunit [Trichophyton mentagrophytes]|nr:hypothetical protein H101_01992 [Trichophyton interdigitale H6]GBF65743.1 target of rapamycin complex 2 subunit [Trichophyton mentagrophytes]